MPYSSEGQWREAKEEMLACSLVMLGWIILIGFGLTPWDTWEANPFYNGPPVCHPED